MGKKDNKIRALEEEVVQYQYDVEFLEGRILDLTNKITKMYELTPPEKKRNLLDRIFGRTDV